MRAAPPVEIGLGTGRRERTVVALVWAAALMALVSWGQLRGWVAYAAGWAVAGAIVGAVFGWCIATPMQGRITWDGRAWSWQAPHSLVRRPMGELRLMFDLGTWMLLCTDNVGWRRRWCGISAGDAGPEWHGLQLALRNPSRPKPTEPAA